MYITHSYTKSAQNYVFPVDRRPSGGAARARLPEGQGQDEERGGVRDAGGLGGRGGRRGRHWVGGRGRRGLREGRQEVSGEEEEGEGEGEIERKGKGKG